MDIWTLIILAGVGFLLLSFFVKNNPFQGLSLPFISNNQTSNQTSNLPSPIQRGIDTLERKYELPLWVLVLLMIFMYIIFKR